MVRQGSWEGGTLFLWRQPTQVPEGYPCVKSGHQEGKNRTGQNTPEKKSPQPKRGRPDHYGVSSGSSGPPGRQASLWTLLHG